MHHQGTKAIETSRLVLRPFRPEDAVPMYDNWASDPEVTKYLTWPAHESPEVTRMVLADWVASYEKDNYYQWAIELEGQPVGSISAVHIHEKTNAVEVGYCIGKRWWHRGITSEALAAVIDFFFREVGANRVHARHDPNNPNSGAVMAKCGMTQEGTLRQAAWNNQGICDLRCYGILRSEWEPGM